MDKASAKVTRQVIALHQNPIFDLCTNYPTSYDSSPSLSPPGSPSTPPPSDPLSPPPPQDAFAEATRELSGRFRQEALSQICAAHNEALAREFRAGRVAGHVLEVPFSDRAAVAAAVLGTGIHAVKEGSAQFAASVHVEPTGVAFVFSVWVYVISVSRRF